MESQFLNEVELDGQAGHVELEDSGTAGLSKAISLVKGKYTVDYYNGASHQCGKLLDISEVISLWGGKKYDQNKLKERCEEDLEEAKKGIDALTKMYNELKSAI